MKKNISMLLVFCFMFLLSVNSFAYEAVNDDEIIEEVYGIYNTSAETDIEPLATGLIKKYSLTLAKNSSQLLISANTTGTPDVTKCGFTYIKLQRLLNGKWTDYTSYCYSDVYNNTYFKTFSTSVNAPKGYTYRVICEHYADKPRLVLFTATEKIYNETTSLYF